MEKVCGFVTPGRETSVYCHAEPFGKKPVYSVCDKKGKYPTWCMTHEFMHGAFMAMVEMWAAKGAT